MDVVGKVTTQSDGLVIEVWSIDRESYSTLPPISLDVNSGPIKFVAYLTVAEARELGSYLLLAAGKAERDDQGPTAARPAEHQESEA